jgi:putative ATP-binding cassette transporter
MRLVAYLLERSRGVVVLSVLAGVVGGLSGVALIALIHEGLGSERPGREVAWAFAGLCLLAATTRVVAQAAMIRLGQGTITELALRLCRQVLALPLERFEEVDSSGLLAVLTEDIVIVANGLVGFPLVCINLPIMVVCLAYIGWLSPLVLACSVVFAALAISAFLALSSRGLRLLRRARSGQDVLVGHFRALIDGFRELKQHRARREALVAGALEPAADAVRDRTTAGLTFYAAAEGWGQLAYFGFLGFTLFLLPVLKPFDRQTLAGVALVVLYIMAPLDVLLTWLPALGRARASMQKIQALLPSLEARGEAEGPASARGLGGCHDALRLEGVVYEYRHEPDGHGFTLGPIDLALRPSELVFLVGGNGSGKTTLVKLLSGLYRPTEGSIRLDGRTITPELAEDYRQLFSVVFADGYLFKDLLGIDPRGLDGRARDLLARLELSEIVRVEAASFSSTELSHGQRRRLALLTACLEDRPICIFDEWAANQDPHFRRVFYHDLLPELRAAGKTLLVISHDEEYFDVADRVLRVRDGLVVEEARIMTGNGRALDEAPDGNALS